MLEKKNSYAKFVKEIHWPSASNKKHEELEDLKKQMKHPVRHPRPLYEINKVRASSDDSAGLYSYDSRNNKQTSLSNRESLKDLSTPLEKAQQLQ